VKTFLLKEMIITFISIPPKPSKSTILKKICEDILFVINLIFSINYLPCGTGYLACPNQNIGPIPEK
jgi:hypothetical protein